MAEPAVISVGFTDYSSKKIDGEVKTSAKCKVCKVTIKGVGTTTSNFIGHLKKHKDLYDQFRESKKPEPKDSRQKTLPFGVTKYPPSHPRQKALVLSIAENLVVDCDLPISSVEKNGFRQFMADVDQHYSNISRKSIVKTITERSLSMKETLKDAFKLVDDVAVTLDIWSDRTMRGFLGVTCHFIKNNILVSKNLATHRITGSHTGERIFEEYQNVITEFGLTGKVKYAVTDNASNMKKAFTVCIPVASSANADPLGDEEEEELMCQEDMWELDDRHADFMECLDIPQTSRLSCFAHSIQLVVGDGLREGKLLQQSISKVVKLSTALHSSTACKEAFEKAYGSRENIPQPNTTRWSSTLRSVESVLKRKFQDLNTLLVDEGRRELTFSAHHWKVLEELAELLHPFATATDMLQGDKAVTISMVAPCILTLLNHVKRFNGENLRSVAVAMRDSMTRRFLGLFSRCHLAIADDLLTAPYSSPIYLIASLMDPNYSILWIQEELRGSEEDMRNIQLEITDLAVALAERLTPNSEEDCMEVQPPAPVTEETEPEACGVLFGSYRKRRKTGSSVAPTSKSARSQMDQYLAMEIEDEVNPFTFWFDLRHSLPKLYRLACHVLIVPATSAPVERVFSHGGIIARPHRATISDKNLSNIIFLKCNRL